MNRRNSVIGRRAVVTEFGEELLPDELVATSRWTKHDGLDHRYSRQNLPALLWMDFISLAHEDEWTLEDCIWHLSPKDSPFVFAQHE